MTDDPAQPSDQTAEGPADRVVEGTRMSFGEHLEELRNRLILALVGNPNAPPLFRSLLPRHVLSTRLTSPMISSSELE